MKIFLYIVFFIWCVFNLAQYIRKYRENREIIDLVCLIALILMIPALCILLFSEIIG